MIVFGFMNVIIVTVGLLSRLERIREAFSTLDTVPQILYDVHQLNI